MMLVCIWFGLYWVLSSFFDHYIQSSVQISKKKKFSSASGLLLSVQFLLFLVAAVGQFRFSL